MSESNGTRCPTCGHRVKSMFDHVDIKCEHGLTEEQIARLIQDADQPVYQHRLAGASDTDMGR